MHPAINSRLGCQNCYVFQKAWQCLTLPLTVTVLTVNKHQHLCIITKPLACVIILREHPNRPIMLHSQPYKTCN